jgi:protein gp37
MGTVTTIQWTDHTFNPWRGCTKISKGCENCYAEAGSKRNPSVLGVWGPQGTRVLAAPAQWREVLRWNREAELAGKPAKVFCASLADVFEGWSGQMTDAQGKPIWRTGPDYEARELGDPRWPFLLRDARARLRILIEETPWLTWQVLTKRPENMQFPFVPGAWAFNRWPSNVWAMTSVEDQPNADRRIPELLKVPARVRGLSVEPLLGRIDLRGWCRKCQRYCRNGERRQGGNRCDGCEQVLQVPPDIHWVIIGGESGGHARECWVEWVRNLVVQCKEAGVAVFVKQLGKVPTESGTIQLEPGMWEIGNRKPLKLLDAKGGDPEEWPVDLQVREFPHEG